jgi:hypothetical protein
MVAVAYRWLLLRVCFVLLKFKKGPYNCSRYLQAAVIRRLPFAQV